MTLWRLAGRMIREVDGRILARFACQVGWKGARSIRRFRRQARAGRVAPPFLFVSLTNECNLRCQGCWVTPSDPPRRLPHADLRRLFESGRRQGNVFFGLLGGEPLMYPGLWDILAEYPDCFFQVFTNGWFLDREAARTMRRLGNVSPLVSIEGLVETSDARRGGSGVYARALEALEHCRRERLLSGVATSVCGANFEEVVSDRFVDDMIARGVIYLWYYIYRPVGSEPCPELALDEKQLERLRRFLVGARVRAPILVIDAYWDHEGRPVCPAAQGISYHVGPEGDVEPCPPIQFACDNVRNGRPPAEVLADSRFLARFRAAAREATPGCILMEKPLVLRDLLVREDARDTSGRGDGLAALARMRPCASHGTAGCGIPERGWFYRMAKKRWFGGLGAYG